jgi:hypothetical protein
MGRTRKRRNSSGVQTRKLKISIAWIDEALDFSRLSFAASMTRPVRCRNDPSEAAINKNRKNATIRLVA